MPHHFGTDTTLYRRLVDFLAESNRIEGIFRIRSGEMEAFLEFLSLDVPTVGALETLVSVFQPNAPLRRRLGLDVRIGNHIPTRGGPTIEPALNSILNRAAQPYIHSAYSVHQEYEQLHPFMDGNGRSGRALWAWMKYQQGYEFQRAFLHEWYYESLQHNQAT